MTGQTRSRRGGSRCDQTGSVIAFRSAWLIRRFVRAGLRGLTPAVLGLMAAALIALGDTLTGEAEVGIAVAVALTLSRFPLNPALMLLVGGVFRYLLKMGGL